MKKIALLLTLAIAAIACQKEEILELTEPDQKLVLPAEGGATSLRFSSSTNWTAEIKGADWCTVNPASGTQGSMLIEVTGEANEGEETREAKLVISSETLVKEVIISQDYKGALNLEGENKYDVSMWGGDITLAINHNRDYELILPEWITVPKVKGPSVTDEILLNVDPQPTEGTERRGTIVVKSESGNVEVIVRQQAWMPVLNIEEGAVLEIPQKGGEATFKVKASMDYEVILSESEWVSISNEGDTYTLKALDANKTYEIRSVEVSVNPLDENYKKVAKKFNITQKCLETIEGQKVEWSLHLSDIPGFDAKKYSSVAKLGNMVLVANSTKILVLDAKNGALLNTVTLPQGITAESIVVDNGGHILFSPLVKGGGEVPIYLVTDMQKMDAKIFVTMSSPKVYPNGVKEVGNLRIVGDINKKALITLGAISGNNLYASYCEVNNGVAGEWKVTARPDFDASEIWGTERGGIISRSTDPADGFYGICYNPDGSSPYNLHYLDMTSNSWSMAYDTKGCGKDNFHGLAVADFQGKKYLAIQVGAHFDTTEARTLLLDITDKADMKKHYEIRLSKFVNMETSQQGFPINNNFINGANLSSDVSLNITGKTMYMCVMDVRYNVLSCISFQ